MNTKLLAIVTPPYICLGCSNQKTFWEEMFTPENMKTFGRRNSRKRRYIKDGEQYIALNIYFNYSSLENMKITSSEPKCYFGRSEKKFITSLGLKTIIRSKKRSKSRYAITNVSLKNILKVIKESEDFTSEGYVRERSKHEPTKSYFIYQNSFLSV